MSNIDVREIGANLWRFKNRIFSSNTYIYISDDQTKCFIVDPGLDKEGIEEFLDSKNLMPVAVYCTHGHFDHLGSASLLQQKYGSRIHLHAADEKLSKSSNFLLMACKIDCRIKVPTVDIKVSHDDESFDIFDGRVSYHLAPGHTAGSCVISHNDYLFTGDTMYAKSVGLVSLPGEDVALLKKSILNIWERFHGETIVLPGHGASATLSEIKNTNVDLIKFLGI